MKHESRVLQVAAVAALIVGWVPALAGQQGTVGGVLKDETSGNPIVAARVAAVGTNIFAQTNATGHYVLTGVSPGQVTLRVSAIGYGAVTRAVTVTAGEVTGADFSLPLQPYSLDEFVVTVTGEQAKDRKSTRLNSSHRCTSYPVSCL